MPLLLLSQPVLDLRTYEERQEERISKGQDHDCRKRSIYALSTVMNKRSKSLGKASSQDNLARGFLQHVHSSLQFQSRASCISRSTWTQSKINELRGLEQPRNLFPRLLNPFVDYGTTFLPQRTAFLVAHLVEKKLPSPHILMPLPRILS